MTRMTLTEATRVLAEWLAQDLDRLGIDRVTDATANAALDELRSTASDGTYASEVLDRFGEDVPTWRWRELKRILRKELDARHL